MKRRQQRTPKRVLIALCASVALHLAFFTALFVYGYFAQRYRNPTDSAERYAIGLQTISNDAWQKNRSAATDSASVERRKRKRKETKPEGQVVDVVPGNQEKPDDAKYLAERDNKVSKETKAKHQTAFFKNVMPRETATQAREGDGRDNAQQSAGGDNRPQKAPSTKSTKAKKKRIVEIPSAKKQTKLAMKVPLREDGAFVENRTESDDIRGNSDRFVMQPGESDGAEATPTPGGEGPKGILTLVPSEAAVAEITGAAPNDHLKDVDEGSGTFLNTKEWKHASFFNRVKRGIARQWRPVIELRQRDPSGRIYGGRDRYTLVTVTLDRAGVVNDVYVKQSSGLDFLDLEAVRSVERAQPFPNPPEGLMMADARVRFDFGFFLEMGGGRMRLFRRSY